MRKAIAIFLLNLMLVIAVHPVVAMHFCAGTLHTHNLYTPAVEHSCCHASFDTLLETEFEFAPLHVHVHYATETEFNTQTENFSCCDFQLVEISTKEYQHQSERVSTLSPLITELSNSFLLNDLAQVEELNSFNNFTDNFPPDGLFIGDVNLLSYLCILRI